MCSICIVIGSSVSAGSSPQPAGHEKGRSPAGLRPDHIAPRPRLPPRRAKDSVAVMVRLVGSLDRYADVARLLLAQRRDVRADLLQVQTGHLLVEVFRQHVDPLLVVLRMLPEIDLGEYLVGERVGHDEARVAGAAAEI